MLWLLILLFIIGIIYSRFAGNLWWISLILVILPFIAALFIILSAPSQPDSACYDYQFFCSTTTSDRDLFFVLLFLPALGVSTVGSVLVYYLSRKSIRKDKDNNFFESETNLPDATIYYQEVSKK